LSEIAPALEPPTGFGLELLRRATVDEVVLRVVHHVLDLFARQAARCGDLDRLLETGLEILRADGDDTVCVDLERHLDLDLTLGGAAETGEDELAEELVLLGALRLARVFERLLSDVDGALDEVFGELLECRAGERALEVERLVATAGDDEGEVHLRLANAGELAFGLLRGVLEALESHAVLADVDAVLFLEAGDEPVDDPRVVVLAAEERVAGGGDDLEDAVGADLEDRDVEGASAEVVDGDRLLDVAAETVREGRSRGLVDDADDVETCDLARVFRGLTLVVVEVRGDGDDRLGAVSPR